MSKSPTREWVIDFISQFAGQHNTITVVRPFIKMTGSIQAALLLSQVIYWSDRTSMANGWFANTYAEWEEELTLTKYQVMASVKKLKDAGVETSLKKFNGAPTVHYRFDREKFTQWIVKFFDNPEFKNSTNDSVKTLQSSTPTTQKTKASTKKRSNSAVVVAKEVVRLPDNIWTWQQKHVDTYYNDHVTDLDALANAWDRMYVHFTELSLSDERAGIEAYKELVRQNILPDEYKIIIAHTRKVRAWQDNVRISDVMREIGSYKAKFKRSNIINIDPTLDLSKPIEITPILMRNIDDEVAS